MAGKYFRKPTDAEMADGRIPPGQHLAKGFPILTYGDPPDVPTDTWSLKLWGELAGSDCELTWADLMAMPQVDITADFHCVTRWSKLDVQWTGVKLTDICDRVTLSPKTRYVMQHCYGGYTTNLPLADVLRPDTYLVHALNGEPLPRDRGGPARTLVPHLYAWKSAKWICGLEFLAQDESGFWERNGYHRRGDPW
ncbi:MAG: sulfite oxidase-like oxidoreductase, partial [Cyanobacteria bacterium J06648_11]